MKHYSIEDLQDLIAEQQDLIYTYTDYIENYQCPAADCSLCYSHCGIESLQNSIDAAENTITEYQYMMEDLQEGEIEQ